MNNETNNVPAVPVEGHVDTPAGFGSAAAFKLLYRAGEMLASTQLVPDVYRNKPADCALIVEIAARIGASPLMVANSLDIIHGRPSWRAQFLVACVNRSGRFSAMRYEWRGTEGQPDRACRAWARELASGDRLDGVWITWQMVEAEGWSKKSGSKWLTPLREQMFMYRAAAFWTRAYAPDIALGFPTVDEVHDVIDVTPEPAAASVVTLPRAKAEPLGPPLTDGGPGDQRVDATDQARDTVNKQTGEVTKAEADPATDPVTGGVDPLSVKASEAQRKQVATIAGRNGVGREQLDAALADRFGFALADLPVALVALAISFAKDLKPAAAA